MNTDKLFPIMALSYSYRARAELAEYRADGDAIVVIGIPWLMIAPHEQQAQRNHRQTLQQLADRGGLSACEALAILEHRPYRNMPLAASNRQLAATVDAWRRFSGVAICPDCRGERRGPDGLLCRRCGGCAQIDRSTLKPGEVAPFEGAAAAPQPQLAWRDAVQAVLDCYYIGGRDPEKKLRNLGSYIEDLARAVGDKRAPAETGA